MRVLITILLLAGASCYFMSLQSCDYGYLEPVEIVIPDTVSFAADIIPIFTDNCVESGCHVSGGVAPNLTEDNAYWDLWLYDMVDTTNPEESLLYQRMVSTSNPMPPVGTLTEDKTQLIRVWIEQGARNN
jgi:hypothetical protein